MNKRNTVPYKLIWNSVPLIKPNPVSAGTRLDMKKAMTLLPEDNDDARTPSERRVRADALRNEEAILLAAQEVFAKEGVDAPVRRIAAKAGVGVGTLYRRFPARSDLVAAVFRHEVDACAAEAELFSAKMKPYEALESWLVRYTGFLATKKGLAAALHSGDPAFDALPDYFRSRFEPVLAQLLETAALSGSVRKDVVPYDLLRAIGNLSVASGEEGEAHVRRMLSLLMDGLRVSAPMAEHTGKQNNI